MRFPFLRPGGAVSASVAIALALTACGGSDDVDRAGATGSAGGTAGGNDPTAAFETLAGTAAIGAPVTQGQVEIRCASGGDLQTTTGNDGTWRVTLDGQQAFPCAVRVSGGSPPVTLHSYATQPGQINITPLTDLVLAHATRQAPADWFSGGARPDATTIAASRDTLLDALRAAGIVPPAGDPMTTPFVIGDAWDQALDRLAETVDANTGLGGHAGLLAQATQGSFAGVTSAPAAPPPPDTPALATLKALAGTYYVGHVGSTAACFGWGWPTPGPGKPNLKTYYEVRVDGDSGAVTLRPTNPAAFIGPQENAPASVRFDPAGSDSLLQLQNAADGFRVLNLRTTVDGLKPYISFSLDTTGRVVDFRPSPSAAARAIDYSDGNPCYPSASLVEVPTLPPADAEIPAALRGSFSASFSNAPFGGYSDGAQVPGSPYGQGDTVSLVIGRDTLSVDGQVLGAARRPADDGNTVPDAFIFRDGERWYWLYNDADAPRINVYGGAAPSSAATTFFGAMTF